MIKNENCWLKDRCNHCDCNKFCMRMFKLNYLYDSALINDIQRKHKVLVTDKDGTDSEQFVLLSKLEKNIVNVVNGGENICIHSKNCGNGKTSWSLRLVQSYFDKIWINSPLSCRALFINVPHLLMSLKDNISEKNEYVSHIKENIAQADIVIWDDIGTKLITTFESENLLSMIDVRINSGKSNIFTSNLSEEEIHKCLGDRLCSRIWNVKYNIELQGKDKRGL